MGEPPGILVCIGGAPGAGKSTVGALVAAFGGLTLVDLDSVTTPLLEAFGASLGVEADLDAPRFAALRAARYDCLWQVVRDNLVAGRDVLAVAPFTAEGSDAASWRRGARAWGASSVTLCWLDVDRDTAAGRVAARGLPRDVAKRGSTIDRHPHPAVVDRVGLDVVADGGDQPRSTAARVLSAAGVAPAPG